MTTIACLRIANVPMLFGDLLVSSPTPPTNSILLPAIGELTSPAHGKREVYPVGLRQKVCIINNALIIAWAGTQFTAMKVIAALRERFAVAPVTARFLDSVFRECGVYDVKDPEFAGLFLENGILKSFGVNTLNFNDPVLGECHVGGSGAGKLLLAAESAPAQYQVEGTVRDVDNAITTALGFATDFLVEELLAGLQETSFGGGFEVAAITQAGAEKVGDVLILFWVYDPAQGRKPLLKPVIIKWDYVGDDLVIQSLRQERKDTGVYGLADHVISVISAPDREPATRRPAPPDLNCRYLRNCYFSIIEHKTVHRTSSVFHSPAKDGPVRFEEANDHLTLIFDRKHYEREWEWARDVLSIDADSENRF